MLNLNILMLKEFELQDLILGYFYYAIYEHIYLLRFENIIKIILLIAVIGIIYILWTWVDCMKTIEWMIDPKNSDNDQNKDDQNKDDQNKDDQNKDDQNKDDQNKDDQIKRYINELYNIEDLKNVIEQNNLENNNK